MYLCWYNGLRFCLFELILGVLERGFLLESDYFAKLRSKLPIFNNCGAHFSVGKIIHWVGNFGQLEGLIYWIGKLIIY